MYKELVKAYLKEQGFPTEKEFNRLFPNLKELDIKTFCSDYYPDNNDFIEQIISIITNYTFYVTDYYEIDKTIDISLCDKCFKEEFDKYIKLIQDNGWIIYNLKDLYEDFKECINSDKKQEILNKLNDCSYEQLKSLVDGH